MTSHRLAAFKKFLKMLVPPLLLREASAPGEYGLHGDYHSWKEALQDSTGYDCELILEKTKAALLKVKNRETSFERDSVLFDEIEYAWPALAGLMWVAARCGGRIDALDFGGSLGSTYYQNRAFLSSLSGLRWNVVEQVRHVEIGKALFADSRLFFYSSIAESLAHSQPNVVLFNSVLQYLEHPYTVLDQAMAIPADAIIIDRTSFWDGPTDRLCVQRVPPSIYQASYPSWIFSRKRFRSQVREPWRIMVAYDDSDRLPGPVDFSYQGMMLVRNSRSFSSGAT